MVVARPRSQSPELSFLARRLGRLSRWLKDPSSYPCLTESEIVNLSNSFDLWESLLECEEKGLYNPFLVVEEEMLSVLKKVFAPEGNEPPLPFVREKLRRWHQLCEVIVSGEIVPRESALVWADELKQLRDACLEALGFAAGPA